MARSHRIAVMFQLEWPHKRHADIFAGAQEYADERGWETVIDEFVGQGPEKRRNAAKPYDGIIGRVNEKSARWAARKGVPVVNVWFSSPVARKLPGVFPDYTAAGRLRAEHLLDRGLRQFCVLARNDRAATAQSDAFCETVAERGFPCETVNLPPRPMHSQADWEKTERKLDELMRVWRLPIGVFAVVDEIGRMVAQMCRGRGWRVPQDVAIIAGANQETICERPRPSLSSIEFGYRRVGYEAARMLDQLMAARKRRRTHIGKRPAQLFLPPQGVVVRESTDFVAVDDKLVAEALRFIAANSHRTIGQDDVSRAVNAETRTLQSHFRKILDRPIVGMIRHVRLERAKRELVQSDRSLRAIARDVGFGGRARMSEVFRRELGITPSAYRRQRQAANHTTGSS
jgi:LacI family transcriptional regulator